MYFTDLINLHCYINEHSVVEPILMVLGRDNKGCIFSPLLSFVFRALGSFPEREWEGEGGKEEKKKRKTKSSQKTL